jgi:thioredoxin 1
MGQVAKLTDADFQTFSSQKGVVLVDFGAPWCPPCRRTDPYVEALAAEIPQARFGKVDCDESPATAAANGVLGMPTFMVFKDGRKVEQIVGAVPKPVLEEAVRRHL